MLVAVDLETECAVEGCSDKECDHALDHNRNRITVIGISNSTGSTSKVFRGVGLVTEFCNWVEQAGPEVKLTAFNGKFDFRQLMAHGARSFNLDRWVHDACLLAFSYHIKISDEWLASYEQQRTHLNKTLKTKHRRAGLHSLKTLAPYFLEVKPFWEAIDHDNDEYVLSFLQEA
jgi:hypothetical protein